MKNTIKREQSAIQSLISNGSIFNHRNSMINSQIQYFRLSKIKITHENIQIQNRRGKEGF